MDDEKTHYQVLGLKPGARHTEIGIAYQRIMGKRRAETAPPDPKLDARIQEAYEVLSDLEQREYYDAELRARMLQRPLPKWRIGAALLAVVALGAGAWWYLKPSESEKLDAEAPQKVAQAAAPAVGKIERIRVSGSVQPAGIAFSTEEGVMASSCHALAPDTQLVVTMLGRKVPVTVRTLDAKTSLCQLTAPNSGSWPLMFTGVAPRPGDRVFAARVDAKGEVSLREGQVKRVLETPQGRAVETNLPVGAEGAGTPLFDPQARVIAIASFAPDGKELYLLPPEAWLGPRTERSASGKTAEEAQRREAQEAAGAAAKPKPVDDLNLPKGNRPPFMSADPNEIVRRGEQTYKPRVPGDI